MIQRELHNYLSQQIDLFIQKCLHTHNTGKGPIYEIHMNYFRNNPVSDKEFKKILYKQVLEYCERHKLLDFVEKL